MTQSITSNNANTNTIINVVNASKRFHQEDAVIAINLEIQQGEFFTILGPSGCGKTTLLRMISGFETPDSGNILINQQNVTHLPPEKRNVNMVFQNYALFPHMSVFENIAFGLRCRGYAYQMIRKKVTETLDRVKLTHLAYRKPDQLSGGQQQRVAIARAIINEPLVLLLDEPLSALDYTLRKEMRIKLKMLQRDLGITFILVTHDQEEALSLSDRIAIMDHGKIKQVGTPRDVYEKPNNLFVAEFIGQANVFDTTIITSNPEFIEVNIAGCHSALENPRHFKSGDKIYIIIRPEDMEAWAKNEINPDELSRMIPGTVSEVIYKGSTVDLVVKLQNNQFIHVTEFFDEQDDELAYEIGEAVYLDWRVGWEVVLPNDE